MVSSGTIKALPASVRQPLGFRTTYNSMHGEQIELSQAYAGALAGIPTTTGTALALGTATANGSGVGASANSVMRGTATGCRPAQAEAVTSVLLHKASTPQVRQAAYCSAQRHHKRCCCGGRFEWVGNKTS